MLKSINIANHYFIADIINTRNNIIVFVKYQQKKITIQPENCYNDQNSLEHKIVNTSRALSLSCKMRKFPKIKCIMFNQAADTWVEIKMRWSQSPPLGRVKLIFLMYTEKIEVNFRNS